MHRVIRDLLKPRSEAARLAAEGHSLTERLREAVAPPPMPNMYVAPRVRTLDALVWALRGYRVFWTKASWCADETGEPRSSVLVYACHAPPDPAEVGEDGEPFDWCVELPTLVPGEVHRLASWLESARTIGYRFALWQAKREALAVLQARARARRTG